MQMQFIRKYSIRPTILQDLRYRNCKCDSFSK